MCDLKEISNLKETVEKCVCARREGAEFMYHLYCPKMQIVIILSNIYNLKFMVCDLKVSQFTVLVH